ncbi:DUF2269 family protein [Deinococcus sonorensis]|uniref:DUF2269 family protein n=2 Tax=Deinococcus sonorensis TaxID=309891 RepID=A0AAU7U593_9DEIO
MHALVLLHVLASIIGIGPTFFMLVLYRRDQSAADLVASLKLIHALEYFPKIGGTLAVLSGLLLTFTGSYGPFTQLWLLGSLVLYITVQVVVIALLGPLTKRLSAWSASTSSSRLTTDATSWLASAHRLTWVANGLAVLLVGLMVLKPR